MSSFKSTLGSMSKLVWGVVALSLLLLGCPHPQNYTLVQKPRYAGCGKEKISDPADLAVRSSHSANPVGEFRIASFNIKFSKEIERATAVLLRNPMLREADILLLQEMDAEGVERIAKALDRCWVYYPATRHPRTKRDFGNAVLSRFPIQEDHKVIFPHLGQFGGTQRIATAVTLLINGQSVRVYSLHVATQVELGPQRREAQVQAVVDDASSFKGPVIVGGDLNDYRLGHVFKDAGYAWNTRNLGRTTSLLKLDHFFVRGLDTRGENSVGRVREVYGSSDHYPIWMTLAAP